MRLYIGLLILLLSQSLCAKERLKYYWFQIMPNNEHWFRVISEGISCPSAVVDGKLVEMDIFEHQKKGFPILLCKLNIKDNIKKLVIGGINMNIPKFYDFKKIGFIGNTGCQLNDKKVQNCYKDWKFANIAFNLLNKKPDLLVHLGGYVYREKCNDSTLCQGINTGDNWDAWKDDFFEPIKYLLESTPLIFTYGEQEKCDKMGNGWRLFFGDKSYCSDEKNSFSVKIDDMLSYLIINGAITKQNIENINLIRRFDTIENIWVISSNPFFACDKNDKISYNHLDSITKISDDHLSNNQKSLLLDQKIKTIISSNFKLQQFCKDKDNNRLQIIIGNSGALMDDDNQYKSDNKYGFTIIKKDPATDSWDIVSYDINGDINNKYKWW